MPLEYPYLLSITYGTPGEYLSHHQSLAQAHQHAARVRPILEARYPGRTRLGLWQACPACNGTGEDRAFFTCCTCNGARKVPIPVTR